MKVRYRILTGRRARRQYREVVEDLKDQGAYYGEHFFGWHGLVRFIGPFGLLRAFVETPNEVLDSEGEADFVQVRRLLLEGRMALTDLVDVGQGWQTVGECYPFEQTALVIRERERARRLQVALAVLGVAVAAAVFGFLLTR
ncbi:MAG: hypothetical protein ACOX6T_12910 [Myxococcales bacterium]|jgi:hypothetical protein